jgi:hypothetical protein
MTLGVSVTDLNPSRQIAASMIDLFNSTESSADMVIAELHAMSDEEVLEIRIQARIFTRMGWRVECACDSEVARRSQARVSRGRHDMEGQQIAKAVQQYAHECAVTPKTVYENTRLHLTFFSSNRAVTREIENGGLQHLEEKEYYKAALATDDPWAAIEKFAQEKAKNPFFSTRDAWRMNKERTTPPLDETVPALCDEPEVVAAWEEFQVACRKIVSTAPRLQNLIGGYLEEIQYELTMPPQTVEATIYDLIRQGYDEADQIAGRMRRDRIYVAVWLNRLCEVGKMESFEKERAPGARGQARTGYREIDS